MLFVVALAPRLLGIGGESLWYDETFTAMVAKLDYAQMWAAIAGDVHPPLFYVLQWLVVKMLGDTEAALRLLPALFGSLSVVVAYRVAGQLGWPKKTATIGALLLAFSPAALYYGQDARMYTLLTFFVLSTLSAQLARKYLLMSVFALAAMLTQNYGIFYMGALYGVGLLLALGRQNFRQAFALIKSSVAVAGVYGIAWLPTFMSQTADVADGFWIPSLSIDEVLVTLATLTSSNRIHELFQLHLYGTSFVLSGLGLWLVRKCASGPYRALLIAGIAGAPIMAGLVSVVWRPIWLPRGLLPSSALMMLAWAYVLTNLPKPVQKVAQLMAGVAIVVGVVAHYYPTIPRANWRAWASPVRDNFRAGDVIYHTALHTRIALGYYTQGLPYALRPHASDLNQSLTEKTKRAIGFRESGFDALANLYQRAWLLVYLNPMSHADEMLAIHGILWRYPHQLISERKNQYALIAIYLITLQDNQRKTIQ
jgi:mannosyltransferase